jgi:hypothetical protein
MKKNMARFGFALFAAALLLLVAAGPAAAATQTFRDQTNFSIFVPCANGGAGENVDGILKVLQVFGITEDGAGGFHGHLQIKLHGAGVGDVTGDTYQMHADIPFLFEHVNDNAGGSETISVDFGLDAIGMGGASNFHATFQGHFTMNANGDVTVDKVTITETCN